MPIAVHNLSSGHLEQIDLWHGSGNVNQSIDSTQAVDYGFEEDLRRPRLAQIERVSQGFCTRGFDCRRSLLQLILLPGSQGNGFEIACQTNRCSTTHALSCVSDDRDGFMTSASPEPLQELHQPRDRAPYTSDCDPHGER